MFKITASGFDRHVPIIFPSQIVHSDIANEITDLLEAKYKAENIEVVSAGECNVTSTGCSGNSETLEKISRGDEDRNVINTMDYFHGMIG